MKEILGVRRILQRRMKESLGVRKNNQLHSNINGRIVKNDKTTTCYKSSYPTKCLAIARHSNTTYFAVHRFV